MARRRVLKNMFFGGAAALLTALALCAPVRAETVRPTDTDEAGEGMVLVQVPGTFEEADVEQLLSRINEIRLEACKEGVPSPGDPSTALTEEDYVPITWSGDLEWIAQTRAAEGAVLMDHERPNGDMCFYCAYNGTSSYGENLAWNSSGMQQGIEQWYAEKADWVAQTPLVVTGHYTSLINPGNVSIGLGCFTSGSGSWGCTAAEFSWDPLDEEPQGFSGDCLQVMEVKAEDVTSRIGGAESMTAGKTEKFALEEEVTCSSDIGTVTTPLIPSEVKGWSVENDAIASIDQEGQMTALRDGTAKLIALLPDGSARKKAVKITPPEKGAELIRDDLHYRVTVVGQELALSKVEASVSELVVPEKVEFYGRTYQITSVAAGACKKKTALKKVTLGKKVKTIGKNAFSGCKKLSKVTLGSGLTTIGSKAFYKCAALKKITIPSKVKKIGKSAFQSCKKLASITIKTKKLSSGKVGSKAFKNTASKLKVKVPKKSRKAYKKWLKKKGISKKAKIK